MLGWLLITVSLPRLQAVATSLLLTLQPVATVVLAAILLGEDPSPLQLVGVAAILAGLMVASFGGTARCRRPGSRASERRADADDLTPAIGLLYIKPIG